MKIPKIISMNNHEYIFEKEYEHYILYRDMITGVRENFTRQELGLVEEVKEKESWNKFNKNYYKV